MIGDVLDFWLLDSDEGNLSTIAPPLEHADVRATIHYIKPRQRPLMLVDTADKMKQCVAELTEFAPSEIVDVESYNKSVPHATS
jgi:hypothetical protein